VRLDDLTAAAAVLGRAGFAVTSTDDALVVHAVDAPAEITRILARHGHYLAELTPLSADLESAFLAITGDTA